MTRTVAILKRAGPVSRLLRRDVEGRSEWVQGVWGRTYGSLGRRTNSSRRTRGLREGAAGPRTTARGDVRLILDIGASRELPS